MKALITETPVTPPVVAASLAHDTGFSSTDSLTSNSSLVGSADPNAVIHFMIDGNPIGATVTADVTGAWKFTPPNLADGTHTILANETVGDILKTFLVAGTFMATSTTPAASLTGTLTVDETTGRITEADLVAGSLPDFTNLASSHVYSTGEWQAQNQRLMETIALTLIFKTLGTPSGYSAPSLNSLVGFSGGAIFGASDSLLKAEAWRLALMPMPE